MKSGQILEDYRSRSDFISQYEFGGQLLKKSHAKVRRPFSGSRAMHFVFSVKDPRYGRKLLESQKKRQIEKKMMFLAKKFSIQIKERNIQYGLIQFVCSSKSKINLGNYLRSLTGIIARIIMEKEKGSNLIGKKFFAQRPFSRILRIKKYSIALWKAQTRSLIVANFISLPKVFNSA